MCFKPPLLQIGEFAMPAHDLHVSLNFAHYIYMYIYKSYNCRSGFTCVENDYMLLGATVIVSASYIIDKSITDQASYIILRHKQSTIARRV